MSIAYNILLAAAALVLGPYYGAKMLFSGKYRNSIGPKLGFTPTETFDAMEGTPRIWVHAVSVGEVTAAAPIVASLRQLFPGACIVLSTSTETGQEMARKFVRSATALFYYPLDIPCVIRKTLDRVAPDVFVAVETEIWPNFIRLCGQRGIGIALVNGRISPRSFRGYGRTKFFWEAFFNRIDQIGAISETDAARLQKLGVETSRVRVLGNAKYDGLAARVSDELRDETIRRLNVSPDVPVLVAGSTHEGEESVVLSVYRELLKEFPGLLLIVVPRHVERSADVIAHARKAGFDDVIAFSDIQAGTGRMTQRVIIIDVIGELFKVYGLATAVFCGGSLVPRGGQNILEAAAWGKVVLYGPSMEDFQDEREALERVGAGITVRNRGELLDALVRLMKHPDLLSEAGERARAMIAANTGASRRHAELIRSVLER